MKCTSNLSPTMSKDKLHPCHCNSHACYCQLANFMSWQCKFTTHKIFVPSRAYLRPYYSTLLKHTIYKPPTFPFIFTTHKTMHSTLFFTALFHLLLILSPPGTMLVPNGFNRVSCMVCAATRPLDRKAGDAYVTFNPGDKRYISKEGTQGHGYEDCLPKGFRRNSAPSRYINDQTFGSSLCSSSKDELKP